MSASGGSKAIIAAFLANMGIALAKFIAAALSGSASMLAEAIHSVADSGNQLLLMFGGKRAEHEADREHPFGYGRERYVSAFVVSIILFSVGGVFAIYEGVQKIRDPHELDQTWWWLPIAVLVISIVLEGTSLRTAMKESNKVREKGQSWGSFVRRAKAPELPVVLLEDTGALVGLTFALLGVGLTVLTGNPLFDALGTIFIGALLVLIAIVLGIETKSLLIGEGANPADHDRIVDAINSGDEIEKIIHMKTLYLGPDELMVAVKIALNANKPLRDVADDINAIEARIREAVPVARVIYIEPDVYRPAIDPQPSTDVFVLKSSD